MAGQGVVYVYSRLTILRRLELDFYVTMQSFAKKSSSHVINTVSLLEYSWFHFSSGKIKVCEKLL